jgi:hypothetical protein
MNTLTRERCLRFVLPSAHYQYFGLCLKCDQFSRARRQLAALRPPQKKGSTRVSPDNKTDKLLYQPDQWHAFMALRRI